MAAGTASTSTPDLVSPSTSTVSPLQKGPSSLRVGEGVTVRREGAGRGEGALSGEEDLLLSSPFADEIMEITYLRKKQGVGT